MDRVKFAVSQYKEHRSWFQDRSMFHLGHSETEGLWDEVVQWIGEDIALKVRVEQNWAVGNVRVGELV